MSFLNSLLTLLARTDHQKTRLAIRQMKKTRGGDPSQWFSPIKSGDVVFDFGGYEGEWAAAMRHISDCYLHVFEPHPKFAKALDARFTEDKMVAVHAFALGAEDGSFELSDDADASSAFAVGALAVTCQVVSFEKFLDSHNIGEVAATKMNIEGGEYDLLAAMIATGHMTGSTKLPSSFTIMGRVRKANGTRSALISPKPTTAFGAMILFGNSGGGAEDQADGFQGQRLAISPLRVQLSASRKRPKERPFYVPPPHLP